MVRNFTLIAAVAASFALVSCKKADNDKSQGEAYKNIEKTFDDSEPSKAERKPMPGVNLEKLGSDKGRFEKLVDTLPSPCGKAHSLRTSRNNDASCKRAPFAVEYVFELVSDGGSVSEIKEIYALRFRKVTAVKISMTPEIPHSGPSDAPIKIAEFYDYGCPACKAMKSALEETLKSYDTDVAVFYKQFPLDSHGAESIASAQAAIAAGKQDKFKEMHDLLFEDQHNHKADTLTRYAKQIGLDMVAYERDFKAAEALVTADKEEGVALGITGTPMLYINGIQYEGLTHPKYLKMWIEEQLADAR